jgi:uncharacterized membrane protein required for colicin V production
MEEKHYKERKLEIIEKYLKEERNSTKHSFFLLGIVLIILIFFCLYVMLSVS